MSLGGKVLAVRLIASVGQYKSSMAEAGAATALFGAKTDATLSKLEAGARRHQTAIRGVGNAAGIMGGLAAAGVALAVTKYAQFDKQMSAVRAATHATGGEMKALSSIAIKLGADTQFSAVEAGQGIEELAKAGVKTSAILGGALKGSLDLAAAGDLSVAESANIAATAMTQFGLSGKAVPHIADLLAAGAGKAQGSVQDLGQALNQSGLVAAGMGLSIEETTGSLAAFASAGLTGSDAGTSLKTAIQRLQAPMGRGAKALEEYGISAYDTKGNFVGMTAVAEQLRTKLGHLSSAQRNAALAQIFGADAIRVGTIMYRQGATGMQKWIDKTNDAGYAAETARLRTDNLAGDVERLGGSFDSLFIGMGKGANGGMRMFVQTAENIVDLLGSIPGPILSTVTAAMALTAAFGLAVFAATRLVGAVGSTRASLALLASQAKATGMSLATMDKGLMLKNAARGASALAGLAIASGAAGNMMGLSNTAGLALMGTMGGPLGVAAGAAVGAIMDVAAANKGLEQSFNDAQKTLSSSATFAAQTKNLKGLSKATAEYSDISVGSLGSIKEGLKIITGQDTIVEKQRKQYAEAKKGITEYRMSVMQLADQTLGARDGINEVFDTSKMQKFADTVGPVLSAAGLDIDAVFKSRPGSKMFDEAVAAINEWKAATDTAAGRSGAVADAISGVGSELSTAATSADTLAAALNNLFAPAMGYDQAVGKMAQGIRDLKKELSSGPMTLNVKSEEGLKNVTAIQNSVTDLGKAMSAAAENGAGPDKLATMMQKGRQAILDTAVAAGYNADQVNAMLNKYGLTPDLVKTVLELTGADTAKAGLDGVLGTADDVKNSNPKVDVGLTGQDAAIAGLDGILGTIDDLSASDPRVQVYAETDGASAGLDGIIGTVDDLNQSQIDLLIQTYGLDSAEAGTQNLQGMLGDLDGTTAGADVYLNGAGDVQSQASGAKGAVTGFDGTTGTGHLRAKNETKVDVGAARNSVEGLNKVTGTAKVKVDVKKPALDIGGLASKIGSIAKQNAAPKVSVSGTAKAKSDAAAVASAVKKLNSVKGKATASVNVSGALASVARLAAAIRSLPKPKVAQGGIFPGGVGINMSIPSFRVGGLPPHIQRAGVARAIYAEPDTQGETFIPWAMDRRKRATKILGTTAAHFGYDLTPRGMSAAGAGSSPTIIVQSPGANQPLVGSLTVAANSEREAARAMRGVDFEMRKIRSGGRWSQ